MKKNLAKRILSAALVIGMVLSVSVSASVAGTTKITFPNAFATEEMKSAGDVVSDTFDISFTKVSGYDTYDYAYEEESLEGVFTVTGTYYLIHASLGATFTLPYECNNLGAVEVVINDLGKPSMQLQNPNPSGEWVEEEIAFNGQIRYPYPDQTSYKLYAKGGVVTFDRAGTFWVRVGDQLSNGDLKWVEFIVQVGDTATQPSPSVNPNLTAKVNQSPVLVDGKKTDFQAYNIEDYNYFKLRDIAYALSGSAKQFEVTWDNERRAIDLVTGKAYTAVGGEMSIGSKESKTPTLNTAPVYLGGELAKLSAYTIDGNNYFKLRDLGEALGFHVDWDAENGTIILLTTPETEATK